MPSFLRSASKKLANFTRSASRKREAKGSVGPKASRSARGKYGNTEVGVDADCHAGAEGAVILGRHGAEAHGRAGVKASGRAHGKHGNTEVAVEGDCQAGVEGEMKVGRHGPEAHAFAGFKTSGKAYGRNGAIEAGVKGEFKAGAEANISRKGVDCSVGTKASAGAYGKISDKVNAGVKATGGAAHAKARAHADYDPETGYIDAGVGGGLGLGVGMEADADVRVDTKGIARGANNAPSVMEHFIDPKNSTTFICDPGSMRMKLVVWGPGGGFAWTEYKKHSEFYVEPGTTYVETEHPRNIQVFVNDKCVEDLKDVVYSYEQVRLNKKGKVRKTLR
mmetsp:Transcript_132953/g.234298  ORF Transcript_132953/g.234298 Transcript_132953/m.234298 type:complete len:335 (+) Transcript_132953:73-1077(+)